MLFKFIVGQWKSLTIIGLVIAVMAFVRSYGELREGVAHARSEKAQLSTLVAIKEQEITRLKWEAEELNNILIEREKRAELIEAELHRRKSQLAELKNRNDYIKTWSDSIYPAELD